MAYTTVRVRGWHEAAPLGAVQMRGNTMQDNVFHLGDYRPVRCLCGECDPENYELRMRARETWLKVEGEIHQKRGRK